MMKPDKGSSAVSHSVRKKFRDAYDASVDDGLSCGESMARPEFQEECDIHSIMKKFEATGIAPEVLKSNPQFGDFSSVPSYQESLNVVANAQGLFNSFPARVRARFDNDPALFLGFASDPKNARELVSLGLATERPSKVDPGLTSSPAPSVDPGSKQKP